nr:retrotransposon protein, putative, unclassified [Tanacetum cinerariifolium]
MDVKSVFLYGTIDKEVYLSQPPGFIDPKFSNKVYKVVKALYGLHQALRAWYATLYTFLEKSGYRRGAIHKTLFIKHDKKDIMLKSWCDEFKELMKNRFQMSSMGELTFFLRLQVKQKEDGIFINQVKYVAEILKKFDFLNVETASTPIETQKPLVKDEEADDVDTIMATSTTEVEYVADAHCFIVYQMDVKSVFLYGTIDKEVYLSQPPGFIDPKFPNKVYKVVKALYGLHQALRAWYATLYTFLEKSGYRRGAIDKTLFIKHDKKDIMLV